MISESEVRLAVKWYDRILPGQLREHERVLIAFAESWLGRKMPEKRYCSMQRHEENKGKKCVVCKEFSVWNFLIDQCRLASAVSEESIAEIIEKQQGYTSGMSPYIDDADKKKLAHAIAEHINQQKGE